MKLPDSGNPRIGGDRQPLNLFDIIGLEDASGDMERSVLLRLLEMRRILQHLGSVVVVASYILDLQYKRMTIQFSFLFLWMNPPSTTNLSSHCISHPLCKSDPHFLKLYLGY
ncbi:hypothetical protein C5167_039632 [Papaver somniferum]|uniref:Uncharacterized protein n=1 Tax=Papaver somniferum TaxID=3469 RepID=A0A4Y7IGW9_PAPSO|nr:hypothetical protein C5167_039632 [Papaver somniferum]